MFRVQIAVLDDTVSAVGMDDPRAVTVFETGKTYENRAEAARVARLAQNLDRVIERGIRRAQSVLEEGYTTRGGIPKSKTRSERRDDELRLEQIVEILDLLQWYGEWGTTNHGIKMELLRRAKER